MKATLAVLIALLPLAALAETPANELPMYGGQSEPSAERNPGFSKDAASSGWKAYYQGDHATAMKRFNQAWMLDPENPEAYWGFGVLVGQRARQGEPQKNLEESIRFLKTASEKDTKNGRILGDLAFSYTMLGECLASEGKDGKPNFQKAEKLFPEAFKFAPDYPPVVANWSVFFFYTKNFVAAKAKAEEATRMGYKFEPGYLKEIEAQKTAPNH